MLKITIALLTLLLVMGANCGPRGRIGPTTEACGILGEVTSESTVEFTYIGIMGDPLAQPGLLMELISMASYWMDKNYQHYITDYQWIETSQVTGENGKLVATGVRDWNQLQGVGIVFTSAVVSKPNATDCSCVAAMQYNTCTRQDDDNLEIAMSLSCGSIPTWMPNPFVNANIDNLTDLERDFINGLISIASTSEPMTMALNGEGEDEPLHTSLVQQMGSAVGDGQYVKDVTNLVAGNAVDHNDFITNSYPFMYSFAFETEEPIDLNELQFNGIVRTDIYPEGVNVDINIISSNSANTRHIARTSYIFPTNSVLTPPEVVVVYDRWTPFDGDPNSPEYIEFERLMDTSNPDFLEEGNHIPDRMMMGVTIPIKGVDGYMEFELDENSLIFEFITSWLTSNKNFDMNNDGIVNLPDIYIGGFFQ